MLERWSICSAYVSNILLQKDLPCAPLRSSRGAGVSPKISAPPMRPALLSRLDILGPNQAIHTAVSIATPEVRIFLSTADRLRAWSSPWPEAVQRTEGVNVIPQNLRKRIRSFFGHAYTTDTYLPLWANPALERFPAAIALGAAGEALLDTSLRGTRWRDGRAGL